MEHGAFCWADLAAHDMDAAARWYAARLGWEVQRMPDTDRLPYAVFTRGGKRVAGVGQMCPEMQEAGIPPVWNSYINVDDAAAVEARARALGASVTVETFSIRGVARLAFLVDPTGANFALWQPDGQAGTELLNEPGAMVWNELTTKRVGVAREFYASLLDWRYRDLPMPGWTYTEIRVGERSFGGMLAPHHEPPEGATPCWMVYFAVQDVDAVARDVEGSGGVVLAPPFDTPGGRLCVLQDPQGGVFATIRLLTAET
ncbi:MAG: VOC family protein [Myxococcales bacterium]|nr:VOC family protein [Myxococcales bacterium]